MSRAWTQRLGTRGSVPGAAWYELYRVPTATTVVLRDVTIVNPTTAAITEAALRIRPLQRAGEVWLWYAKNLAVGTVRFDVRQVLVAGEALEFFALEPGAHVSATGYVFN